jgi:hypothetical protein
VSRRFRGFRPISADFRQFPPGLAFRDLAPTLTAQAIEIVDESRDRICWRGISAFSAFSAACFASTPFRTAQMLKIAPRLSGLCSGE